MKNIAKSITNTKLNDLKALAITKDDAKKVKGGIIIITDWDGI